jgi:hypothetical protein
VKAHRLVVLAVAGASLLALSGCSQSGTVAAKVGDRTVPTSDVDFLTRMQCDALEKAANDPAQAGGAQMVAVSQVRTSMLNTLVQAELDRQLAEQKHLSYDQATLRNVMVQFQSVLDEVPAKDRDRFRDIVEDVYRGQLQVYSLAQQRLVAEGKDNPSQSDVDKAISAIQDEYRKTVKVDVNPQYGPDADGVAGKADPSLSLAVSSFAKQSRSSQPQASWIAKLPDNQRCG